MGLHHTPNPQLAQFFYQQQQQQGSGMNLGPNPMPSMVSPIHQNLNNMNNMANHISSNENYSSYNINTSVGSNASNIGSGVPLGIQQQQQQQQRNINQNQQYEKIFQNILELLDPETREQALIELNKKKDTYEDLAPILWNSFGVMTILLQEIVSIYPLLLLSTNMTNTYLNRKGCAINLLQCIASHNDTRSLFLRTHILYFLYPFLKTNSRNRSVEYLRKATLYLISSMVKNDNKEAIEFLITSEIIPLFLRILEVGSEPEKNFTIIIIYKILCCDSGLIYICQSINRFHAVEITLR